MRLIRLLLYQVSSYDYFSVFFFNDTATTEIYTLSLHDALPIATPAAPGARRAHAGRPRRSPPRRRRRPRPRPLGWGGPSEWGAPRWPPTPPRARRVPGDPGRASIPPHARRVPGNPGRASIPLRARPGRGSIPWASRARRGPGGRRRERR